MPVVRALYPRMVPADTVRALFAFDTTAQELIWVTGPVVVTVLASLVSTEVPLLAAAGITVTGSIAFVLSHPFAGPMALQPQPFEHALGVYDSVDATP